MVVLNSCEEETFTFQAEMSQLMSLIVNNFYSNKDVFLREMISNCSDAIDKVKHTHLLNGTVEEYGIKIRAYKEENMLSIEDNGVGMTKEDLCNNLGTIAHSGTKVFTEALKSKDMNLIGQFGVGFYSAFLVADKVRVITQVEGEQQSNIWESTCNSTYTVSVDANNLLLHRGTRIDLFLKEDLHEYLDTNRLQEIIRKHSNFIIYPIVLWVEKTKTEEVTDDEAEEEIEEDNNEVNDDVNTVDLEESPKIQEVADEEDESEVEKKEKPKKTKQVTSTYNDWEHLNTQKPIWTKDSKDTTEDEYKSFYRTLTNSWGDYLGVKHFAIEGNIEFQSVLYVPDKNLDNMLEKRKKSNIKLYVNRVLVSDDCCELVPDWLLFVTGVVDSADLPLNVSREMFQNNHIIKTIQTQVVKKTFDMMDELAEDPEKYAFFYNNYSKNLKLGLHQDPTNKEKLMRFLRFYTSKSKTNLRTLDQYIEDMPEKQTDIYYITGEALEVVDTSPFVEKLKQQGFEVLYMTETLDEYTLQNFTEYKDKKMLNITRESFSLGNEKNTEEEKTMEEENNKDHDELCRAISSVLGNKISKVVLGQRILDSPCCLVTSDIGWSANMQRLMKAQALVDHEQRHMMLSMTKKIMEINKDHIVIKELKKRVDNKDVDKTFNDLVDLLYNISLLNSGFNVENIQGFSSKMCRMIQLGLGLEEEEANVEFEVTEKTHVDLPEDAVMVEGTDMEAVD